MSSSRRPITVVATGLTLLVLTVIGIRPAHADELSDKRAEAQKIAARLTELDERMMDVNAQYEAANFQLHQAEQRVAEAQALADRTAAEVDQRESELRKFAVNAYVSGGNVESFDVLVTSSADDGVISKSYLESMSGNRKDLVDSLNSVRARAEEDRARLDGARQDAERSAKEIEAARSAARAARDEQASLNAKVQGELSALVQKEQEAQRARQAAAAAAAAAAQRSAATGRAGSGGQVNVNAPPVNGSAASVAIQAMLSQLGKPYVWGAAGPDAFDCSGLIQWAFAKAGVSLPHYSGAMFNMSTRISASQLQPGDLVFYGSGGSEHVAVYMGGGRLVHTFSPPTGVAVTQLEGWWKPPSGYGRLNL